jgi:1-pyrroline-5-carboxylate dehydrogenase
LDPDFARLGVDARAAGVCFAGRGNLILLAPPLVIEERDLDHALSLLDRLLAELGQGFGNTRPRGHRMSFKLTYASMFNPPAELHARFDAALAEVREGLGRSHALHVDGADVPAARSFEKRSPIDQSLLGHFPRGDAGDVERAVAAARAAFPAGARRPGASAWRHAARRRLIETRVYHIAAALTLEVGKNRLEALAEVQETADFFVLYGEDFERHDGFEHALPNDPLPGSVAQPQRDATLRRVGRGRAVQLSRSRSRRAGRRRARHGNTVVLKGATDTPGPGACWPTACATRACRPACSTTAGPGARGRRRADRARRHRRHHVHGLVRRRHGHLPALRERQWPTPASRRWAARTRRSCSRNADLERAALGIVRSASAWAAEVLGAVAAVRRGAGGRRADRKLRGKIGALRDRRPDARENWLGR